MFKKEKDIGRIKPFFSLDQRLHFCAESLQSLIESLSNYVMLFELCITNVRSKAFSLCKINT